METLNGVWVFLVENAFLICWVAISASLLTSALESYKARKAKSNSKENAVLPKILTNAEYAAKQLNTKLERLMEIHSITKDEAIYLQQTIDDEWLAVEVKAQNVVDKINHERLKKLRKSN